MTRTITMDKAGRITVPKDMRERLGVRPQSKIRLREIRDGVLVIEAGRDPRELRGIIKPRGIHLTVEQIGEIIEQQGRD